jgi:WD40 repeat protein
MTVYRLLVSSKGTAMKPTHSLILYLLLTLLTACSSKEPAVQPVSHAKPAARPTTSPPAAAKANDNAAKAPESPQKKAADAEFIKRSKKALAQPVGPVEIVDMPDVPGSHDAVVLFQDGKRVAVCGDDGAVRVHVVETKEVLMTFEGLPGEPRLAVSKNGAFLAQASRTDGRIKLWNIDKKDEARNLEGHEFPISDLKFSPDSSQLAAATLSAESQGSIRVWIVSENSAPVVIESGGVTSIDYSPDSKQLVAAIQPAGTNATTSSAVSVWDMATRTASLSVPNKYGPTYRVAYSPDGKTLAIAERNGPNALLCADRVRLIDPVSGTERGALIGHAGEIQGMSFTPDGLLMLTAGHDLLLRVWQVPTFSMRAILNLGGYDSGQITVSSDGSQFSIAAGHGEKEVHPIVWTVQGALRGERSVRNLAPLAQRVLTDRTRRQIIALAFSSDGKRLATSNHAGETRVYDVNGWARQDKIGDAIFAANAFSPDLEKAVVLNKMLQVRDLQTGALRDLGDRVTELKSFSQVLPSGRTGTMSGTAQLLHALALSSDGRLLLTSNSEYSQGYRLTEGILKLRNFETSEMVAAAGHSESYPTSCAISSDATRLVIGAGFEFATQRIHHKGPISVYDLKNFANRKDWKRRLLKRTVLRDVSNAEKEAFLQAAKIYERQGSDDELRSVLQGVVSELDEIRTSTDPLDSHWQVFQLNESGAQFDGVKFRIPEGDAVDFTWAMTFTPGVIDGDVLPVANDTQGLKKRDVLSAIEYQYGGDFRQRVIRSMSGEGVRPGSEFIVWFFLGEPTPTEGAVAVNIVRRGFLEAEGWVAPPANSTDGDVPVMRRMHLFFHGNGVTDVAILQDGSHVASVGENGTVKVWNVDQEQVIANCMGVLAEFSPDGKMLATTEIRGDTPVVVLRDSLTCRELHTLRGKHFLGISALAFSPDSKQLAVGGRDGIVMVWNTATGKPE